MKRKPLEQRFLDKVNKTKSCWLWTASTDRAGYGHFHYKGKQMMAHRMSLLIHGIELIEGLSVNHLCKKTSCVNPNHLEQIPLIDNVLLGDSPASQNKRKTHCKRGHLFTKESVYTDNGYGRHCIKCKQIWWKEVRSLQKRRNANNFQR